ncbi:OmpA family protein [Nocardiopsis alkaliphila]|uniref:OmpA family protein n=1 Tax=Nocardiopsis alkaliphila TaxID=225762 RepID=UPI001EF9EFAC|nr:OmpA family protein [Nocardiopsis alkaliphila]
MTSNNFEPPGKISPAGATLAALVLLTSGCVATTEPRPEEDRNSSHPPSGDIGSSGGNKNEPLATSITTSTEIGSDLKIEIQSLENLESGILRLQIGVTNDSSEAFDLGFLMAQTNDPLSASNISLIDEANQKKYISYDQISGDCLCNNLEGDLPPGETSSLWIAYPGAPNNLEKMTVITPITPPFPNVPVSTSTESIDSTHLEDPEILDLTTISDSLEDDQTGRTESLDEVSIILSSDVLFETNSSTLSDEAQEILKQVAQEIDDASASVISIDGHADNTGNDSVNIPLSKERAETVESTLTNLVTRNGVIFEVEGHGSADPIADNQTEEGRERNRRVSVTFEK